VVPSLLYLLKCLVILAYTALHGQIKAKGVASLLLTGPSVNSFSQNFALGVISVLKLRYIVVHYRLGSIGYLCHQPLQELKIPGIELNLICVHLPKYPNSYSWVQGLTGF
jgi:hypothetical protein